MVSVVALFVALGGGAYAAFHLPRNSVRSKNIVNGQVKPRDIGAPLKFKSALLGTVCEGTEWVNNNPNLANEAAYARDAFGVVHLRGLVDKCGSPQGNSKVFVLPPGYGPAKIEFQAAGVGSTPANVLIYAGGRVEVQDPVGEASLDGITFRCGPSGKNGCP